MSARRTAGAHQLVADGGPEVTGANASAVEASRDDAAGRLPEPHALIPKATARRGTRRMAPEIRAVVGKVLTRSRAMEVIGSGQLDPGRCKVVWNVRDRAVAHPVSEMQIPSLEELRPVRRIGTYKGAGSRMAMYPVLRGGKVTMLELESRLELDHATALSLDPRVSEIFAQPFLMVWRHEEGAVTHVPDLAALVEGRLTVFGVKPDDRAGEEWTRLIFALVAESLRCGHVDFQVLGSVTKQRQVNLERLARYRSPDPSLAALVAAVGPGRPRTIGGFYRAVCAHLGYGQEFRWPKPHCPSLIGVDAAVYALAHGWVSADLDEPLDLTTTLRWAGDGGGQ